MQNMRASPSNTTTTLRASAILLRPDAVTSAAMLSPAIRRLRAAAILLTIFHYCHGMICLPRRQRRAARCLHDDVVAYVILVCPPMPRFCFLFARHVVASATGSKSHAPAKMRWHAVVPLRAARARRDRQHCRGEECRPLRRSARCCRLIRADAILAREIFHHAFRVVAWRSALMPTLFFVILFAAFACTPACGAPFEVA